MRSQCGRPWRSWSTASPQGSHLYRQHGMLVEGLGNLQRLNVDHVPTGPRYMRFNHTCFAQTGASLTQDSNTQEWTTKVEQLSNPTKFGRLSSLRNTSQVLLSQSVRWTLWHGSRGRAGGRAGQSRIGE